MSDTNFLRVESDLDTVPRWYMVQVRSQFENVALQNLLTRLESFELQDNVIDFVVPTRTRKRIVRGKEQEVVERLYPGYIFAHMIFNTKMQEVINTTEYVRGLVGGAYPTPLDEKEVQHMFSRSEQVHGDEVEVDFKEGDVVKIIDGPFSNLQGKVSGVDMLKSNVRVLVSMFGRETPVDLSFFQIERVM